MEDEENEYRWMNTYERTWEAIKEDESGSILQTVNKIASFNRRKSKISKNIQRSACMSVMRHLILIIDASEAMGQYDYHPNRLKVIVKILETFLKKFFDQNPISQIGVIVTYESDCKIFCDLTNDEQRLTESLNKIIISNGLPSIQNSIETSMCMFADVPPSSSREVLIIYGSIVTCDPGDVFETIKKLSSICVSVISLSSEMYLLKNISEQTRGRHFVCSDEHSLNECLSFHLHFPQKANKNRVPHTTTLIRMGFPPHIISEQLSLCVCHFKPSNAGFFCPQCSAKYCHLPSECNVCGLLLVLAPHLARSYQRFFPLDPFKEEDNQNE
ncbi:hypothetical protein MXB_1938, partial [Myxobolus squamalis]